MTVFDSICDHCGVKVIGFRERPSETCPYCLRQTGYPGAIRIIARELPAKKPEITDIICECGMPQGCSHFPLEGNHE